jgi:hypothetical protein
MGNGINPPDYTTDAGLVRLLIPDVAIDVNGDFLFNDEQIDGLLGLFGGNVKRAAAQAKDIIATDQVMLLKVVRTDDLSVNGAQVAAELRLEAKALRDQADTADSLTASDYFDIIYPAPVGYPEAVPIPWGRQASVGPVPWPVD